MVLQDKQDIKNYKKKKRRRKIACSHLSGTSSKFRKGEPQRVMLDDI